MLNKTFQNGSGEEGGAKLMILVWETFFQRPETLEDDGGDIIILYLLY